jgi:hypothetical protein
MSNTRKAKGLRMARIELPSGGWVEYRDQLKASDRFHVHDAVTLEFRAEGNRASLGMINDQRNALLGRIITSWSFPVPVPSQNDFQAADVIIGEAMDIDDYAVIVEAVQPLMDKISGTTVRSDPKKP